MQVLTKLLNDTKISADLIATKDINGKAISYDDKFRFTKLSSGGNYATGSYQTLSENPKNFDFLIYTYRSTDGGSYAYAWQSVVIPTELIEFTTSTTSSPTKLWQLSLYQKSTVYATTSIMFYNVDDTYRIYWYIDECKGWGGIIAKAVYGVKLK